MADAEIEDMRKRMTHAAQMDAICRQEGNPAMNKLKLLPEVLTLLNRNQYMNSLVDPEINLLEAVRFFLEPLDDGSMPAYNIQRDLLTALSKLPINKDTLIASGIGKVVVFYTKSRRTERRIKVMAENLLAEWTRPILQRSDDYSKRVFQTADYDPTYVSTHPTMAGWLLMKCTAKLSGAPRPPPKSLLPKHARVRSSHLVWPIVLVSTAHESATALFPDRRPWPRVGMPARWVPVARTGSARCRPDRMRRSEPLADNSGRCHRSFTLCLLFFLFLFRLGCLAFRD